MWGSSIASRVKKVIAARIEAAQKEHDAHVQKLEEEKQKAVEAHADEMVTKVIGTTV